VVVLFDVFSDRLVVDSLRTPQLTDEWSGCRGGERAEQEHTRRGGGGGGYDAPPASSCSGHYRFPSQIPSRKDDSLQVVVRALIVIDEVVFVTKCRE
jgi:hypothetical protein